jgi:hypothetical protein
MTYTYNINLRERNPMIKILAKPESLVDELYEIMDMVGNIPHPMADDVYSYINQLLLATVVDDD